ncbi:HNH endonuclease [Ferruginibacter albus]|uniref:HNH endonuclease n=1 Tax=Ferruginibacter albus TaxID=2875540 RepID=UPI001CC68830|nr:HNH endonuclease [Ferruginibacter albus]UAY52530.1 HNH endonuclease [Ferruginibacter albus]
MLWTRNELVLAINLYCKLPFGKMHKSNPEVIKFANLIGRTPSSVALKLGNLASFDPTLKERGIKGASNASKLDKQVWDEFYNNWDAALLESEKLLAKEKKTTIVKLNHVDISDITKEGLDKERLIKTRVNQCIFRTMILATYNNTCCITGIDNTDLLIASHIVPWSKDSKNRLNPTNGICLNALHDRAFDKGLITISAKDYTIKVSSKLKGKNIVDSIDTNFLKLEGMEINLPDKFLPAKEFLKVHNDYFKA